MQSKIISKRFALRFAEELTNCLVWRTQKRLFLIKGVQIKCYEDFSGKRGPRKWLLLIMGPNSNPSMMRLYFILSINSSWNGAVLFQGDLENSNKLKIKKAYKFNMFYTLIISSVEKVLYIKSLCLSSLWFSSSESHDAYIPWFTIRIFLELFMIFCLVWATPLPRRI